MSSSSSSCDGGGSRASSNRNRGHRSYANAPSSRTSRRNNIVQFPDYKYVSNARNGTARSTTSWEEYKLKAISEFIKEADNLFVALVRLKSEYSEVNVHSFTKQDVYRILLRLDALGDMLVHGFNVEFARGIRFIFSCMVQQARHRCDHPDWGCFFMEFVNNDDWQALESFFPIDVYFGSDAYEKAMTEKKEPKASAIARRTLAATLTTAAQVIRSDAASSEITDLIHERYNSIRGPNDFYSPVFSVRSRSRSRSRSRTRSPVRRDNNNGNNSPRSTSSQNTITRNNMGSPKSPEFTPAI